MPELTTQGETNAPRDGSETDDVIGRAVRGELADKLNLAPQALDELSPEAAARTLDHLNDLGRRLRTHQQPAEPAGNGTSPSDERRDVVARALRDELAEKLQLHPRLLGGLRVDAAAATLSRVNESVRRVRQAEAGGKSEGETEVATERRDVVARVIRDELSRELGVHPRSLVELSPELAATTLSHLSHIHRRLRRLETEVRGEEPRPAAPTRPDRRDIVGRAIRDELSSKLGLHPSLLGTLHPKAGAAVLTHLQVMSRRLRDLEQRIAVDELTGVLRRAAGQEALEREVERARRGDGRLVIAFIDVDHLKSVNDVQGHAAGDELLQTAAATLRSRLRRYDVVIRWGGDEFVCVLPQTDVDGARKIFDEIDAAYRSRTGDNTFSIGLSSLQDGDNPDELIGRADSELYAHKRRRTEAADRQVAAQQQPEVPEDEDPQESGEPGDEQPAARKQPPAWKRWTALGGFIVLALGAAGAAVTALKAGL